MRSFIGKRHHLCFWKLKRLRWRHQEIQSLVWVFPRPWGRMLCPCMHISSSLLINAFIPTKQCSVIVSTCKCGGTITSYLLPGIASQISSLFPKTLSQSFPSQECWHSTPRNTTGCCQGAANVFSFFSFLNIFGPWTEDWEKGRIWVPSPDLATKSVSAF